MEWVRGKKYFRGPGGEKLWCYKTSAILTPGILFAMITETESDTYTLYIMGRLILSGVTGLETAKQLCEQNIRATYVTIGEYLRELDYKEVQNDSQHGEDNS